MDKHIQFSGTLFTAFGISCASLFWKHSYPLFLADAALLDHCSRALEIDQEYPQKTKFYFFTPWPLLVHLHFCRIFLVYNKEEEKVVPLETAASSLSIMGWLLSHAQISYAGSVESPKNKARNILKDVIYTSAQLFCTISFCQLCVPLLQARHMLPTVQVRDPCWTARLQKVCVLCVQVLSI